MRPESEQPRESNEPRRKPGEAPQQPYEPPQAEDLDVTEGTVATASGDSMTPPPVSDRRLKEEIEPISGALQRLRSL